MSPARPDDPSPRPGPTFAFIDVNYSDLHLTGPDIPDSFDTGLNVRIVATVGEFVADGGYIELDPISVAIR